VLFSACPLPALAPSVGWSYAWWLRCTLPCAHVTDAGLIGEYGESNPHGAAPAPPRRLAQPASPFTPVFREPTPLLAFATTREDVGYPLENRGLL
jgi:hypothetical protein